MFGKGSVNCNDVNAHKKLAGAQMKGDFGVGPLPGSGAKRKSEGVSGDPFRRGPKA